LATVRPDDLAAVVIKAILERNPTIDPALIGDVILGAANQAGEDNRNVGRMAALLAGLPQSVPGITVNRLCGSGLQAIIDGSRAIGSGDYDFCLAGGTESMTRAPFVMGKAESAFSRNNEVYDTTMGWRFTNPALSKLYHPYTMGETAENVATHFNISRLMQDEFAVRSQVRYATAYEKHHFGNEVVPVTVRHGKGTTTLFDKDEHPRASSLEALEKLKPAFKSDGSVTAGNSSGINDGAAVALLASEEMVIKHGLKPMARVVSTGIAGVHPEIMGIGPVPATDIALKKAGLSVKDLDLVELNEAFASQALACMQQLALNPDIVNVNGGSIAIGHPLGASGCRITATLLHQMARNNHGRYGLAAMCIGVGQGIAVVYERV
jgi:acetyl-CoA C-acetyltransferase